MYERYIIDTMNHYVNSVRIRCYSKLSNYINVKTKLETYRFSHDMSNTHSYSPATWIKVWVNKIFAFARYG